MSSRLACYLPGRAPSQSYADFFRASFWSSPAIQPIIQTAYITGWRKSEILSREWRHVDFDRGTLCLDRTETKNKTARVFPFSAHPELEAILLGQKTRTDALERALERRIPTVFHRDNGAPIKDFRKAWQNACARAGYPGRYVHDFRRTAIRNLVDAGVDRATAKAIVGHRTDEMFQRYNIQDDNRLAQGVEKLADFHEAETLQVGVQVGKGQVRLMKRGSRK